MDFEEASKVLSEAVRSESRDHAFGDREVFWTVDGEEIAGGYFGGGQADVWILDIEGATWKGEEARKLAELGTVGIIGRNDETGPDTYVEGQTMPALTIEGVKNELLKPPWRK
jgi:hypothetical protein